MVPMHAQKRMESLHPPTHPRPLPGGEQASVRVLSVPLLGGVRGGFMVPVHAQERKEAFHEPTHPRPLPGREQASVSVLSVPLLAGVRGGFMVPMHAQERKEAFHDLSQLLAPEIPFGWTAFVQGP